MTTDRDYADKRWLNDDDDPHEDMLTVIRGMLLILVVSIVLGGANAILSLS